jgi:hypothetical protein
VIAESTRKWNVHNVLQYSAYNTAVGQTSCSTSLRSVVDLCLTFSFLNIKHVRSKVSDYFSKKSMGEMERNLATDGATFAYHVCMHNQSFRSMDCTSKIIRKLYDKKFTCGQKMTQAIIVSVLATYAMAVFRDFFNSFISNQNYSDSIS